MEWVAASIALGTLIVAISAFRLERIKRRDAMRMKVYEEQLKFYIEFFAIAAKIESLLGDFNQPYGNNSAILNQLDYETDALDLLSNQGQFLIPDSLFNKTSDFVVQIWKRTKLLYQEPERWNREQLKEFTNALVDLEEDVREYLGIRRLGEENNKLARRVGRD